MNVQIDQAVADEVRALHADWHKAARTWDGHGEKATDTLILIKHGEALYFAAHALINRMQDVIGGQKQWPPYCHSDCTAAFACLSAENAGLLAANAAQVIPDAAISAAAPDMENEQCRCEPTEWTPPSGYDGDGSVEAMARRSAAPMSAELRDAADILSKVCDLFHIGKLARTESTILTNVKNVIHFTGLLRAVERELFPQPDLPEEDDPHADYEELPTPNSWGAKDEADYVAQFRAALAARAVAPIAEQADARDAAFEAVRQQFCKLPRYSFLLDSHGNIRRSPDFSGNWVEFEAVHTLFDPVAVDAAQAAKSQEGAA